jgi:ABC-type oligopeptide transport system substrate-binding subunit
MFWRYLYNDLTDTERQLLHGEIGEILEDLYRGRTDEITVQLARHFDEAGESEKAAAYLFAAGDQARILHAQQEAIDHYNKALIHLEELGDDERIARTMMRLGLTYHNAFDYKRSQETYDEGFTRWQRLVPKLPNSSTGAVLRINLYRPATLDPSQMHDSNSATLCDQLLSGLVEVSPELEIVPDIAHKWRVDNDGRTYIFYLREDVSWSDGEPLTAADFAYAWRRVLDPGSLTTVAKTLFDIKGAEAYHQGEDSDASRLGIFTPDEFTLIVELEQPAAYFLHLMALTSARAVPRHTVESYGPRWTEPELLVSSGPFILGRPKSGHLYGLDRNPYYHGTRQGNVHRIDLPDVVIDESWQDKVITMYEDGKIDVLNATIFTTETLKRLRARFGDQYVNLPSYLTVALAFNPMIHPFGDARVRQAMVMAVNREQYSRSILGGWIPPGIPGHSPDIGLPFDPERARRLLSEAGFPGGRGFPNVEMLWPRNPTNQRIGRYLQEVWQNQLGITVKDRYIPFNEFMELTRSDYPEIFFHAWTADYPDPDDYLRVANAELMKRWKDEQYLELIDTARQTMDHQKRLALYQQADKILIDEAIIMPLRYHPSHYFVKPWVRHFPLSPLKDFYWKDVIIDPH